MIASEKKWKTRNMMIPLLSCESLVPVKENTERKRKKENVDRPQSKLSPPHFRYNVKTLPR